ncbi:hypothetical protein ACFYXM_00010 [Streptomyces sp. NPDC002476]
MPRCAGRTYFFMVGKAAGFDSRHRIPVRRSAIVGSADLDLWAPQLHQQ